jgi:hypothetical protein
VQGGHPGTWEVLPSPRKAVRATRGRTEARTEGRRGSRSAP